MNELTNEWIIDLIIKLINVNNSNLEVFVYHLVDGDRAGGGEVSVHIHLGVPAHQFTKSKLGVYRISSQNLI